METKGLNLICERSCFRSLEATNDRARSDFLSMTNKVMADPTRTGLNLETLEGAADPSIRSIRLNQNHRAIGSLQGNTLILLYVGDHDDAYRWAKGRRVALDERRGRVRIFETEYVASEEMPPTETTAPVEQANLFSEYGDGVLTDLGVMASELPIVREIVNEADLTARESLLDSTSYDILVGLAAGFSPEEVASQLASTVTGEDQEDKPASIEEATKTSAAQATIFVPKDAEEFRRVLEDPDLQAWRVFLHPDQRKLAYSDYNGPALVRGGAGTGKTVVAMHRARYLADQIAADSARDGEKVLLTTFTSNLAADILQNLKALCPGHLKKGAERIEVVNLDRWVREYLRRRGFDREIIYYGGDDRVAQIWDEVLSGHALPEGLSADFIRNEWAQVVQAQGLQSREDYLKAMRTGRGTRLDRRTRATLWPIFETFRARMREAGLAEPDDAFREATSLLEADSETLPYAAVVVDEAQDMGPQAFRLIRAIAPDGEKGGRNSIFIVGDAHQRIYQRRASLSSCGIEVRGRSRRLRLNYRTSENIRRWAVAVLEGVEIDDLDDGHESSSGYKSLFSGVEPEFVSASDRDEEARLITDRLKALRASALAGSDGEESSARETDPSACVLMRTNKEVDAMADRLRGLGLEVVRLRDNQADDPSFHGLRLATMHRSKGLEFDWIFIAGAEEGSLPPRPALAAAVDAAMKREVLDQERSLIHVAATRAKSFLHVSWVGKPASILRGLPAAST